MVAPVAILVQGLMQRLAGRARRNEQQHGQEQARYACVCHAAMTVVKTKWVHATGSIEAQRARLRKPERARARPQQRSSKARDECARVLMPCYRGMARKPG